MPLPSVRSLAAQLTLTFGLVLSVSLANATTIPASAALGDIPTAPGTGLSAVYDRLSVIPTSLSDAAQQAVALPTPTASYIAETICFPSCNATLADGSTLAAYVATNGSFLSGSTTLGVSYASFTGALLIPTAGNYTFELYADDGASLTIGGRTLIDMEAPQRTEASTSVHFAQAGLYAIALDQFDTGGYTGITLMENGTAIPVADLYQTVAVTATGRQDATVAEPGTLGLLLAGMAGTMALARRRVGMVRAVG